MVKIAFYSLTSCEGCQSEANDIGLVPSLPEGATVISSRLAAVDECDIAIVEGSISSDADLESIKLIRSRAKTLVALGTCACTGGVQSAKNFQKDKGYRHAAIGSAVKVDVMIRGCPIDQDEFSTILKQLLLGNLPPTRQIPVCAECRIRENRCLLEAGQICMGPVSVSGCGSVCTSNSLRCIGCRGLIEGGDIDPFVKALRDRKSQVAAIRESFTTFLNRVEK
jgi:sulfhydrogenase subunit delta